MSDSGSRAIVRILTMSINTIHTLLSLGLSVAGYLIVRRRPAATRGQLIGAAMVGGGIAGAIIAAYVALGGAGIILALPFALTGLVTGVCVGILGVAAFALGRWLGREP
jgi:hypothetical protein